MNTSQAIGRMREVMGRQHKALSTEDGYLFWSGSTGATGEPDGSIYLRCDAAGFIAKDRRVRWYASSGVQRSAMGSKLQALCKGLSTDDFRRLFSPRGTR